ncbi:MULTISPECIES: DUF6777 domain-containing protein [unclassified Streptomyces]|uniref:DUF6777 domain-containing protein n=1 Tax=unclassified Streptomyces TaxID=2593676 RepID=UPI002E8181F6|nr:DUF6777 domain-containing protein [Streptomyces sp. NBC_00589]WTI40985.1 PASTA domain-containing protein [Streptomyces sp. NBC_00775]WUB25331.1 PASTA domain-containing protein [Streptomyces sp. NBC_00589]
MASGISQANPFFKEDGKLGKDTRLPEARATGGVQASNSPGLYGGTPGSGNTPGGGGTGGDTEGGATGEFGGSTKPGTCVVAQLKKFLTAPENSAKAQEWARVLHIDPGEISGYIDQLTPVVLRHDTLVTNHEYKHGKAVPFNSLLQAGIAILVDQQGLPAVKCSCGNPLRPFKGNIKKTSVQFKDGNKKWSGYHQDHIVLVEPPPGNTDIDRLQLVDVQNPDHGIARPLGTEGEDDQSFDTRTEHAVPTVTRKTFAEASQALAAAGLAMTYDGASLPPDDAQVTASEPVEGSTLEWGAAVTLFVRSEESGGQSTPPDSGAVTTGPDESSTGPGESSTGPDESTTGPDESTTGPGESSTGPGESSTGPDESTTGPDESTTGPGETTTGPGESSTGPDTTPPTPPTPSGGTDLPPASSGSPPDTTTSAAATPSESVSTDPASTSTEPTASGAPASSDPASADPGVSDSATGVVYATSVHRTTDSGGLTEGTS